MIKSPKKQLIKYFSLWKDFPLKLFLQLVSEIDQWCSHLNVWETKKLAIVYNWCHYTSLIIVTFIATIENQNQLWIDIFWLCAYSVARLCYTVWNNCGLKNYIDWRIGTVSLMSWKNLYPMTSTKLKCCGRRCWNIDMILISNRQKMNSILLNRMRLETSKRLKHYCYIITIHICEFSQFSSLYASWLIDSRSESHFWKFVVRMSFQARGKYSGFELG